MQPIDVIRRHYDAGSRGDLEGMFADFAPDALFEERSLPAPGVYHGADQVKQIVFPAIGATYRDFRFVLDHLSASDATVIALGWYEAIVLATAEAVRFRTCHVWTVEGGQIKRFEQIADTLAIARALQS